MQTTLSCYYYLLSMLVNLNLHADHWLNSLVTVW